MIMKNLGFVRILGAIIVAVMVSCLVSCLEKEDFGYPSKINLTAVGDTLTLTGSSLEARKIIGIELLDYDGNGNSSYGESSDLTVTTEWLTVSLSLDENKMQLIPEPNITKKKRKLYLYIHSGRGFQDITVQQAK